MHKNLLAVVIMVKNEAHVLENTLKPFADAGVKRFCVFDTGSTDNTVAVAKSFFRNNDLDGVVDEKPFVNFATSRNHSLEFAEKNFPDTKFFVVVDADWYITNVSKLLEFCEKHIDDIDPVYGITMKASNLQYVMPRLLRVAEKNRYVGVVHEEPENKMRKFVDDSVYFTVSETNEHVRKSKARYEKDLELLLKEHKKRALDSRTMFYIGQTYECLGDAKNAHKYYLKRSALKINYEEDSLVFYRLGYLTEHLSLIDKKYDWHMAQDFYIESFTRNCERIDPLIAIASHYIQESPQLSFVYLKYAVSVPFPANHSMFIQPYLYSFVRYELLSACAFAVKEYEVGKKATEMALAIQPQNQGLRQRLIMYKEHLKDHAQNQNTAFNKIEAPFLQKKTEMSQPVV